MNAYRLGLYEKSMPDTVSMPDKLKLARETGFDFMEISIDETDAKLARLWWTREERLELLRAMYEQDLFIRTMCLSGHRRFPIGSEDDAVRARGMEIMRDAISLASDLGIRIIQIAGYDEYYKESNANTRARFAESLAESVRIAAAAGVILAFETMETEFLNTIAKAMAHVEANDSPYLKVYPDLGNITNAAVLYGTKVSDDIARGRGHIAAMHLKETVPGVFREVLFGTGHTDFEAGIRQALEQGVRMYVGEFWHQSGGAEWLEQMKTANAFLRARFDAVLKTQA